MRASECARGGQHSAPVRSGRYDALVFTIVFWAGRQGHAAAPDESTCGAGLPDFQNRAGRLTSNFISPPKGPAFDILVDVISRPSRHGVGHRTGVSLTLAVLRFDPMPLERQDLNAEPARGSSLRVRDANQAGGATALWQDASLAGLRLRAPVAFPSITPRGPLCKRPRRSSRAGIHCSTTGRPNCRPAVGVAAGSSAAKAGSTRRRSSSGHWPMPRATDCRTWRRHMGSPFSRPGAAEPRAFHRANVGRAISPVEACTPLSSSTNAGMSAGLWMW